MLYVYRCLQHYVTIQMQLENCYPCTAQLRQVLVGSRWVGKLATGSDTSAHCFFLTMVPSIRPLFIVSPSVILYLSPPALGDQVNEVVG